MHLFNNPRFLEEEMGLIFTSENKNEILSKQHFY